jgi:hypothetical protein
MSVGVGKVRRKVKHSTLTLHAFDIFSLPGLTNVSPSLDILSVSNAFGITC